MNIRELLQIELWSKRTSRKILFVFGVVFAASAFGFFTWFEVEVHWLTNGERAAAKVAFQRIDALQHADPMSNEEFKIRSDEVDTAVSAAENAARTKKDESISVELMMCSMGAESVRMKKLKQGWIQQGKMSETAKDRELDDQIQLFTDSLVKQSCSQLHKELD
jgi:hypothetical protein